MLNGIITASAVRCCRCNETAVALCPTRITQCYGAQLYAACKARKCGVCLLQQGVTECWRHSVRVWLHGVLWYAQLLQQVCCLGWRPAADAAAVRADPVPSLLLFILLLLLVPQAPHKDAQVQDKSLLHHVRHERGLWTLRVPPVAET
jgi:hypothetical protein